jgi:hypothetical protein
VEDIGGNPSIPGLFDLVLEYSTVVTISPIFKTLGDLRKRWTDEKYKLEV